MKKFFMVVCLVLVLSPVTAKDTSSVERFHLEYTSRGSMWPVMIRFTVDRKGNCSYSFRNRRTGATKGFTARLSRRDLLVLKSSLLNKYNFFSLPAFNYRDHRESMVKDASTTYITVSMSGKTRRVGGYAVSHVRIYRPVFRYIQTLIRNMGRKHFND